MERTMAKLIFTYGAMNAGKTTVLLQVAHNYEEWGLKAKIFTYKGCSTDGRCQCRLGVSKPCQDYDKDFSFADVDLTDIAILLVDEAQFLTEKQVHELGKITVHKNVPVMCFGLRTSWQAHVFEGASALLGLADELRDIKTICRCGHKAIMASKVSKTGSTQDEDIGQGKYLSVCRKCWLEQNPELA